MPTQEVMEGINQLNNYYLIKSHWSIQRSYNVQLVQCLDKLGSRNKSRSCTHPPHRRLRSIVTQQETLEKVTLPMKLQLSKEDRVPSNLMILNIKKIQRGLHVRNILAERGLKDKEMKFQLCTFWDSYGPTTNTPCIKSLRLCSFLLFLFLSKKYWARLFQSQ